MKKIYLLTLMSLVLVLLYGCQMLVLEEDSFEYRQLSDQYNDYVMNDVIDYDDFIDIMNDATNISTTSVFMVETNELDIFRRLVNQKYGTGTIIFSDINYNYILTTFEMIDLKSRFVSYYIYDAYGTKLSAEIFAADSTLNLGILRSLKTDETYHIVDFPDYMPLSNEMVIMISNSYPVQNMHKLGLYLYQDEMSYVNVVSSKYANGSPVFNLQLELIGIQYLYGESYILLVDYKDIYEFVSPLLPLWQND